MAGQWTIEDAPTTGKWVIEDEPAAVTTGKAVNSIPRQLGLTARYGLEGVAQAGQVFTEPVAALMRLGGIKTKSLGEMATGLADTLGLPSPQGANERVIGDATRLVAGSGGLAGAASLGASLPGMAGKVLGSLAANPVQQLSSAAGAGLLGGASREAGGDSLMQAGAGMLGGVIGGMAPGAISGAVNAGKRLITPAMSQQQLDLKLSAILGDAGADYSQFPAQVQDSLRKELASSLQAGKELDPQAVRRLADFRTVGATPTRGMVTQNPVQITREMNLAKVGATGSDSELQGLAMLQNQNNGALIRNLNDAGAATGDPFQAGANVIGRISSLDAAKAKSVTGLYDAARAMPGADVPLDRTALVDGIYGALIKENKLAYLPEDIGRTLNTISKGQIVRDGQTFQVPFNANTLDNLMTDLATAQRSTQDGNVKRALGLAREALDKMPVTPVGKTQYAGSPMVTAGGADFLRGQDASAAGYLGALNEAKSAARQRFGWQESAKPIEAALSGMEPDKFVQKFVIGGTLADAQSVAQTAPNAGVKEALLAHLKEKSLGGAADEVGKFSQAAYNKALLNIGDRKLNLFFSPEEVAHLKAVGRVASYAQVQPVGSAVNNSNSGALLLGRGMDLLNKIPGVGPMVGPALKNIDISLKQRQAQNILPGLLATNPKTPMLDGLLLPGLAMSGGLLSP